MFLRLPQPGSCREAHMLWLKEQDDNYGDRSLVEKKGECVDHLAPNSNSCTKAQSDIGMECQDTGAQCNNGKDRVRKNAKCKMQKESGQWKMVKLEGGKVQLWQHLNNNINSCFLQMRTLCEVWIIVIDGFPAYFISKRTSPLLQSTWLWQVLNMFC